MKSEEEIERKRTEIDAIRRMDHKAGLDDFTRRQCDEGTKRNMKPIYECTVCRHLYQDELGTQDEGRCNSNHSDEQTEAIICQRCDSVLQANSTGEKGDEARGRAMKVVCERAADCGDETCLHAQPHESGPHCGVCDEPDARCVVDAADWLVFKDTGTIAVMIWPRKKAA